MHVFIDSDNLEKVQEFSDLLGYGPAVRLHNLSMPTELQQETVFYGTTLFDKDADNYRLLMTELAANGSVLFSDNPVHSVLPLYAGGLPETKFMQSAKLLVEFSQNRAKLANSFGVKFLGRTYDDPRHILVLDNKKSFNDEAQRFLSECEPSWWSDLAIVTTSNVEKYRDFFNYFCYSIPLVYSESAKSKLRHIDVDYCEIPAPGTDRNYGVTVRILANKSSNELYLKEIKDG